jgi:pimeloyl-ACP methyl ester carboxylesterase
MVTAGLFLAEFLGGDRVPALTRVMPPAGRRPFVVPGVAADVYVRPALRAPPPLVLVHGVAREGKDDPRAVRAADLLALAGFRVVVPTVPGLTRGRLRPGDVEPVVRAVQAAGDGTDRRVTVLGVSIGAGPALLAAADPRVRDRVSAVVGLGGYASAPEVVRFFLTGDYAFGSARGHVDHDPAHVAEFLAANADLVDDDVRRALGSGDRARVLEGLTSLSPDTRRLLDELSPERVVRQLDARLVLVHARRDPAVPYTESLRLAAARPRGTTVIVVEDVLDHVEGRPAAIGHAAADLVRLWAALYGLLRG